MGSPDPLFKKFPGLSTYSFGADNPIWNIDKEGRKKETYNVTINQQKGTVVIKKTTTNDLFKLEQKVPSMAFGFYTHDYETEYEWHDYSQVNTTVIDKDGKSHTTTNNIIGKNRTTTNFDWGQGYANLKLGEAFKPTKDNGSFSGLILTSGEGGGSDNKFNPRAAAGSRYVDVGPILKAFSLSGNAMQVEAPDNLVGALEFLNTSVDEAKELNGSAPIETGSGEKKKDNIQYCTDCNQYYKDGKSTQDKPEKGEQVDTINVQQHQ